MKLGILASGNLGLKILEYISGEHNIEFVFTDSGSISIQAFARRKGLPLFIGNPRNGRCSDFIADKQIDILASVNYLFLIESELINLPSKLAFNIHGSLLPRYRGRTPHVWAIINNEQETGVTAHVMDENCDTGHILAQARIPILPEDTGASLLEKLTEKYPELVEKVIEMVYKNNFEGIPQDESMATYFGKRSPTDGEINWNWYRDRIQNWIRAQAPPYPGAFSFYKDEKVVFKSSKPSPVGFHYGQQNGTILQVSPLTIKTPNGAIEVDTVSLERTILFEKGGAFEKKD
jgi:methionyl-tRNA formyltransferase